MNERIPEGVRRARNSPSHFSSFTIVVFCLVLVRNNRAVVALVQESVL